MSEETQFPVQKLGEVVEVLDHLRIPVNSEARAKRKGDVPYYGANGLQGWIDKPIFNEPLILMAEDGGNFDDYSTRPIAYRIDGPAWVNNHAHIIKAINPKLHSFIYWSVAHKDIRRYVAGGTRQKLNQSALKEIKIPCPPEDEGEVAGKVLDTLDTQIQTTEALIAKLEKVKEGLLHDLLTRGIDEDSRLRPSPEQAPELYKGSPLGLIPREWDITLMRDLTTLVKSGLSRAIKDSDIGIPVLTSTNMVEDELSPENLKYWWRKDPQGANVNNYMLDDGDILLNFINSIEKIGKSCIYRDIGREAIYTTNIFRVKTSSLVSSEFLWRLLNSLHLKGWMKKITKPAINQASFTKPEFLAIPVAIPPVKEQSAIVLALENIDKNTRAKISDAEKLVDQKTGLMDDLLTGRVRVTPLLEQAQATTPA